MKKPSGAGTRNPIAPDVMFTTLTKCSVCKSMPLVKIPDGIREAHVWNGSSWNLIKHGTKRCTSFKGCHRNFRLNYIMARSGKWNTLVELNDDQIVLVSDTIGFTVGYLRQYWNRVCRCGVSAESEATTLLLTFPGVSLGSAIRSSAARALHGTKHSNFNFLDRLYRYLIVAMFSYLRLSNKEVDFNISDPVPKNDPEFGKPSSGFFVIFDAAKHDPTHAKSNKLYCNKW